VLFVVDVVEEALVVVFLCFMNKIPLSYSHHPPKSKKIKNKKKYCDRNDNKFV
jgi:hypothetical protein